MGERTFKHGGSLCWVTFRVYTNREMELFYKPWEGLVPSKQTWSLVLFRSGFLPIHFSPRTPNPTLSFGYYRLMASRRVHSLTGWLLQPLWSDKDTVLGSDFHHLLLRVSLNEIWQSSQTGRETLLTRNSGLVKSFLPLTITSHPYLQEHACSSLLTYLAPSWVHTPPPQYTLSVCLSLFFFLPEPEPNSLSP